MGEVVMLIADSSLWLASTKSRNTFENHSEFNEDELCREF